MRLTFNVVALQSVSSSMEIMLKLSGWIGCRSCFSVNCVIDLILFFRWMLCGSALTGRCVGAVWDLFESPRRGDGLHKRTSQGSCAQGQTRNSGEDLWWVQPELVFPYSMPCLHYHFPLNFHLHCHFVLWLSRESHIASSIWFLNDPWLGFTLAGIYRLLPLLAPDWLTLTRCILRHWNRTDEYYVARSGSSTTHTNTTMPCDWKPAWPLAHTQHTDFEEVLLIMKCVDFLWFYFFRVVLFWERW